MGSKIYGQAGPGPEMGGGTGFTGEPQSGAQSGPTGDGVVDADYEVIDDSQK